MAESPKFTLKIAETPSEIQSIRELFTAYVASLNLDLSFQDYSNELSSLPGKYGPDLKGVLLLAVSAQNVAIGCVGLRSLDSENKVCEMKRLYCLPETRGMGVGKALVDEVLKRAKELGYSEMRLDTLPQMIVPRKIYRERGFEEIPAYYDTPLENTIFLAKKL